MQQLTPTGEQAVQDMSRRYGVSVDAVRTLLNAVSAGGGTMAQFYHSELGGGGQWMSGGMTMVGDMFNSGLQSTVSGLCGELSNLLASQQVFAPAPAPAGGGFTGGMAQGNQWWPGDLGSPSSSGGQNGSRYAYFPQARRLAVEQNGQAVVYDTLDHQIGGVQQQQGSGPGSLSFSSQFGTFSADSLPRVSPQGAPPLPAPPPPVYAPPPPAYAPQAVNDTPQAGSHDRPARSPDEVISAIDRLGQLHQQGVLSQEEFNAKKAELLALI